MAQALLSLRYSIGGKIIKKDDEKFNYWAKQSITHSRKKIVSQISTLCRSFFTF